MNVPFNLKRIEGIAVEEKAKDQGPNLGKIYYCLLSNSCNYKALIITVIILCIIIYIIINNISIICFIGQNILLKSTFGQGSAKRGEQVSVFLKA